MADKFPALEGIESDVPTGGADGFEESDFLSREKELLGDEFKTEQDGEVLNGSDDEINEFKEQFPEVDEKATRETINETNGFSAGAYDESTKSVPNEPNSKHLEEWRERRDLEISEREKANAKKKEGITTKARQTIDDFYENYNNKKEEHSKQVLEEQDKFLEKRDGFLGRGTLWDRVNELVKEVGEVPSEGNRDKSRFQGLLAKLKGKENAPGAGGY